MKNKTQGFTLIELLIVIAIIGILAAVLIPQLLGARASAQKRAIQAHASNVYKALTASLADNTTSKGPEIATANATCKTAQTTVPLGATPALPAAQFGWNAAPGVVDTCLITWDAVKGDFSVAVAGKADGSTTVTSTNGQGVL